MRRRYLQTSLIEAQSVGARTDDVIARDTPTLVWNRSSVLGRNRTSSQRTQVGCQYSIAVYRNMFVNDPGLQAIHSTSRLEAMNSFVTPI